jgi:hypothetical protein
MTSVNNIELNESKKIIEETIESKFNQLLTTLPNIIKENSNRPKDSNDFFELSIIDIYKNTLQTIIDIINDIINLYETSHNQFNFKRLLIIFFNENRMFYIGIILIILSFIIYFIDGATI